MVILFSRYKISFLIFIAIIIVTSCGIKNDYLSRLKKENRHLELYSYEEALDYIGVKDRKLITKIFIDGVVISEVSLDSILKNRKDKIFYVMKIRNSDTLDSKYWSMILISDKGL